MLQKVRVDKWLWAIRVFKSRTMATDACKDNKVKVNGETARPSLVVERGDTVMVKKNNFNFVYKVVDLIENRVSAQLAAPNFEDLTPPEELNKFKDWFVGSAGKESRERGTGRPTKKDRREIDGFKEGDDTFLEEED
jgi:ribosome-associated heat shock protein Hsp15